MIVFGPVPSRRLGHSLGINNIPPKACSYSCVYCQVGPTAATEVEPRRFYAPQQVAEQVGESLERLRESGNPVDFLTFVPDGEPTLDANLDRAIELLRPLGIPIAVITNGSLLWRADVRNALMAADWVSVKVDAIRDDVWRRINRPDPTLRLSDVLSGLVTFSDTFEGVLATETMLVKGVNDKQSIVTETAQFISGLRPRKAYLAVPTRPPTELWCEPPDEVIVNAAYQLFAERVPDVECLVEELETGFLAAGEVESDILAITSVHPMTEEALQTFLHSRGASSATIARLLERGHLKAVTYGGRTFYVRRFRHEPYASR
jgi:wyosine [tRNA(Phe)-imidazoG37] synthetase (radical SAM superfamily)